jgi:hypothetical protein
MTALYSIAVVSLSQLLSSLYNFQYLIALGVNPKIHPITIEDNIQTALTQLPIFVLSILLPVLYGIILATVNPKFFNNESKKINTSIVTAILPPVIFLLLNILMACFLKNNYQIRVAVLMYITFTFMMLLIFYLKLTSIFSLNEMQNRFIFSGLYVAFLIFLHLLNGEQNGQADREQELIHYIVKIKNEKEEYIACTSIRVYANDILLVSDGIVRFVKKDLVSQILVIN